MSRSMARYGLLLACIVSMHLDQSRALSFFYGKYDHFAATREGNKQAEGSENTFSCTQYGDTKGSQLHVAMFSGRNGSSVAEYSAGAYCKCAVKTFTAVPCIMRLQTDVMSLNQSIYSGADMVTLGIKFEYARGFYASEVTILTMGLAKVLGYSISAKDGASTVQYMSKASHVGSPGELDNIPDTYVTCRGGCENESKPCNATCMPKLADGGNVTRLLGYSSLPYLYRRPDLTYLPFGVDRETRDLQYTAHVMLSAAFFSAEHPATTSTDSGIFAHIGSILRSATWKDFEDPVFGSSNHHSAVLDDMATRIFEAFNFKSPNAAQDAFVYVIMSK